MNSHDQGFTLLETLISVLIIGGVGILITQVFFSTTRVNTKTELVKDVKQNGQFAIDTVSRLIRNARSINSICSDLGTTLTELEIENQDGNITTLGCQFDSSENVTRIASVSAAQSSADYLTSQNVTLGGISCADSAMTLSFYCVTNSDVSTKVTVSFRLSQKGVPVDQFETASVLFQTTVSPRN